VQEFSTSVLFVLASARSKSGISIVLKKGNRLRLDTQPRGGLNAAPCTHYYADYNAGAENTIYAGVDTASYLMLPIIPKKVG
jgi:hypothetical protein